MLHRKELLYRERICCIYNNPNELFYFINRKFDVKIVIVIVVGVDLHCDLPNISSKLIIFYMVFITASYERI